MPGDPELEVEIGAFLDGEPLNNATVTPFYAEGKLLFFILSVEDIDRDEGEPGFQPSGVFGFLELDIMGDEDTGRVTLNHLISASIEDLFDINFGVEATLNTHDDPGHRRHRSAATEGRFRGQLVAGTWTTAPASRSSACRTSASTSARSSPTSSSRSPTRSATSSIRSSRSWRCSPTEIPGLDVICDPPNLLGLINLILRTLGYSEIPEEFFNAVRSMIDIVDQVDAMIGTEGEILLGDILGLGHRQRRPPGRTRARVPVTGFRRSWTGSPPESTGGRASRTGVQSGGSSTDRGGFEIVDYILDISNWMKLITGGDAILFTYELPLLEYELNFRQDIATITAGPVVINIYAVGGFSFTADLGFGYDTYGIRKAIDTGNWWYVFDGFYVADWGITSGRRKKTSSPSALEIGLEATLWLLLVEAGLGRRGRLRDGPGPAGHQRRRPDPSLRVRHDVELYRQRCPGRAAQPDQPERPGLLQSLCVRRCGHLHPHHRQDHDAGWWTGRSSTSPWPSGSTRRPRCSRCWPTSKGDTLVLHTGKRAGDREYLDTDDGGEKLTLTGDSGSITVAYGEWEWTYDRQLRQGHRGRRRGQRRVRCLRP